MNRILLPSLLVALTLSSCGKNIFSKNNTPGASTQNSSTQNGNGSSGGPPASCDAFAATLDSAGMGRVKSGLDQVVRQISPSDYDQLVLGAKIHRRSQNRNRYSSQEVSIAINNSVSILNRFGDQLYRNNVVSRAPALTPDDYYSQGNCYAYNSGTYGRGHGHEHGRDHQRDGNRGRERRGGRDRYGREHDPVNGAEADSSFLGFGLSAGEDVADAGFALSGGTYANINGDDYEILLSYTAVKSHYVLRAYPINSGNSDGSNSGNGFSLDQCREHPKFQQWTQMPRSQPDMNECECGNCANMARD